MRIAETDDRLGLRVVREAQINPSPDPYAIACLLWRDEAIAALAEFGADRGVRTKRRTLIWQRLADHVPLEHLRRAVRAALRIRPQRVAELAQTSR